ncbi:unnamed protein product [Acanthoscelides obtectus]|uniref:Uncharacterized protein n=1 Tax=Acanthoscelides obtectus TaxID=200917 RepID=A0A9P0LEX9_ACAOB|nr:unnamed protein product [Acanthoscelides obtectus]CAK1650233.1 hypothetical protein AOBTE_LOCUS16705 [Acanthoscelides obtectus]
MRSTREPMRTWLHQTVKIDGRYWKEITKKFCDNNKKQAGVGFFEYADIMADILVDKKNINPVLLLSSNTVEHLKEPEISDTSRVDMLNTPALESPEEQLLTPHSSRETPRRQHHKTKTYPNKRLKNLNIYTSLISMDNRRQISSNLISARESLAAGSDHR